MGNTVIGGSTTIVSTQTSYVSHSSASAPTTASSAPGFASTDGVDLTGGAGGGSAVAFDAGLLAASSSLSAAACAALQGFVATLPPNASVDMIAAAFGGVLSALQSQGIEVDASAVEYVLGLFDQTVGQSCSGSAVAALSGYGVALEDLATQVDAYAQQLNLDPSSLTQSQRADLALLILGGAASVGTTTGGFSALQGQTDILRDSYFSSTMSVAFSTGTNAAGGVNLSIQIRIAVHTFVSQNPAGFASGINGLNNNYPNTLDRGMAAREALCGFIDNMSSAGLRSVGKSFGLDIDNLSDAQIAQTLKNMVMTIDAEVLGKLTAKIMTLDSQSTSYADNVSQATIDALQAQIDALTQRVAELEAAVSNGVDPTDPDLDLDLDPIPDPGKPQDFGSGNIAIGSGA